MRHFLVNHPAVLFILYALGLWGAAMFGAWLRRRDLDESQQADFSLILGATLTLLGLIIGFSFSMATSRYDLRKTLEEAEANAIGTELVRAELLPKAVATNVTGLLTVYLDERIKFYGADVEELPAVDAETAKLQTHLWEAVKPTALASPTPINALVVAGMNDVLNSQGYTQAAWWNRIPTAAWALMSLIAVAANILLGFNSHRLRGQRVVLAILPLLASVAFLLIADLDSPRGGLIHVTPQNLLSLADSIKPH